MNSVQVKKIAFGIFCTGVLLICTTSVQAQQTEEKKLAPLSEEEEGPLMFKFEPDFLTSIEIRREEIKRTRAIIDTLNISDRKRRRLLRDLYKNGISERLSRAMVAQTKFEDDREEDVEN